VLAGALALTLLAGHFQIAAYVWLAALGYAAARALWEAVNRRPWFPASLAAAFALGAIVGAAQVIPSLELGLHSTRGAGRPTEAGFEFHRARALQSEELIILLRPDSFGNPAHGDHVLVRYGLPYAAHCGFVGIITVVGKPLGEQSHRFFGVSPLEKLLCGPCVLFAAVQRTHPCALARASTRWSYCTLSRLG